ncbi:unnamed protein product [Cladocopium goreaui]|uniref:Uncharacterized protein n=1 Tax=Cladocopium goreaui TaxID=2562237 RepID=A0A9P1CCS0_9DINO|nr:unnamed protein product [Cladocopium goreaui]
MSVLERDKGHAQVEQGTQQLAQKRMEFVQELATRQAPVALAAGLLQGFRLDGLLGVPAMVSDLLAGRDYWRLSPAQRVAAQRRLCLGARASLARSSVAEAHSIEDQDTYQNLLQLQKLEAILIYLGKVSKYLKVRSSGSFFGG